jgi:TRAP-type C4-dicarboxylate transport system permease small subunit
MERFHPFLERSSRLLYAASAVCLLAIVVLLMARILSRNLGLGVGGVQILAQLFEVWLTFLVVGSLAYANKHIEIEYLSDRLPERWRPIHELAVTLVSLFAAVLILVGSLLAMSSFRNSTAPTIDIPIPLYYLAPVVGLGFLVVVYLDRIHENVAEVLR